MKDKRPPFDARGSYVARKAFRFHGRTYAPGAEFPWRRLSCSARKLLQLYDNGFLVLATGQGGEPEPQAEQADSSSKSERRRLAAQKAAETRKRNAEAKARAEAEAAEAAEAEGDGSAEEDPGE